jgi:hypothetical protein
MARSVGFNADPASSFWISYAPSTVNASFDVSVASHRTW